jgi:methyltransferase family protein
VLPASRQRILDQVPDDAVVLDLGGWADPFERADWVIDVMPYDTRGLYQRRGWREGAAGPERFTEATWVRRDLCAREPYPFADGQIDFVVCSHTLEDVRDPVWICSEMARVGKAGYVEVPSRLEEQSRGVYGRPYVGWDHHRWIIDIHDGHVEFTFKSHAIHTTPGASFPEGFWDGLTEDEKVQTLWWEGGFSAAERVLIDEDPHLVEFVSRELARRPAPPRRRGGRGRLRRAASRLRPRAGS